jgi:hypothetical protein
VGLALVSIDRERIIGNRDLFWDELGEVGETDDPFLLSAALYRFVCLAEPFRLGRVGRGSLIHPIVAERVNAAAGLRLCYALGQATYALGEGLGQYRPFERYVYAHSESVLRQGATLSAGDVALHFKEIFAGRLGFLSVP